MKKVFYRWTSTIDKGAEIIDVTMCDEWDFGDWLTAQNCKWEIVTEGVYRVVDEWNDTIGCYEVLREEMI